MPNLYYQTETPGVNILKTVTEEVVSGLLQELRLVESFKDAVFIMSPFMAASKYNDRNGKPTLNGNNRCDVEVNHIMDKSQVPWPVETPYTTTAYGVKAHSSGNHTPILYDASAGILIEHHTIACALDMNFSLSFATFDEACRAFDAIQIRYKGALIGKPFDLAFSYPITTGLYEYLTSVYKAKTAYQSKSFMDYINDTKVSQISFDVRKSQLTDPKADVELMIRCTQMQCLGQLTMDQKEPEVSRIDDLPDNYTVSFQFQFQFGRPNLISIKTPVSVDNTVLPPALFSSVNQEDHYNPLLSGVYQDLMCNTFMRRSQGNFKNSAQILRLPTYDDWFSCDTLYQFYAYRPFLIAHFTLDGDASVLDLTQLDAIQLHPVTQAILKEMGNGVFQYGGIFNINVFAGDLRLGTELVSIDEDLKLTVLSDRPDQVYHLVISESTDLTKMDGKWDPLLIKYRYFFPLTIERNIQHLISKRYFFITYDNTVLNIIGKMEKTGQLKAVLQAMIDVGEDSSMIYGYTQSPSQLADYLSYTQSHRQDYVLPNGSDPASGAVRSYYETVASVEGRSLLVAFFEMCLIKGYLTLAAIPKQYLQPNTALYPYYNTQGGYYGFNTPLRVINTNIIAERKL